MANKCEICKGEGVVEIIGEAGDHGWDKVDEKPCPSCFPVLID